MRVIELSRGQAAIVDDEDFDRAAQYRWHYATVGYARRSAGKHRKEYLHHFIVGVPPKGMQVDHINGNKLDNRRSNLRIVSKAENGMNRGKNKNNTVGYKGVTFSKKEGKYIAQITKGSKHIRLGCFTTPEEAALAYNAAAVRLHGEFANTN